MDNRIFKMIGRMIVALKQLEKISFCFLFFVFLFFFCGAIDTVGRGRNKELGHVRRHNRRKKIDKLVTILNLTKTLNIRLIQEALFGI